MIKMELNFVAIIVLTDWIRQESSMDDKSVGNSQWGTGYWHDFKVFPHRLLISDKGKNSNHTEEKSGSILIQCRENWH